MGALSRLLAYLRRLPRQYALGIVLTLAYAGLFQLIPLAVRRIVESIETDAPRTVVEEAVVQLVLLAAVFAAVRYASRMVLFRAGRELEFQIRNDFLSHLQCLPQSFFHANRTGDLMSRAVNDINSVRLLLGMGLLNIVQTPVLYAGALLVMITVDVPLTLWVLAPFPLFVLIIRFFGGRMFQANLAAQQQLGAVSNAVQEGASGMLVVRAYGLQAQECARFEDDNQHLFRNAVRVVKINASMQAIIALLPATAMMLVLLQGGRAVESGRLASADLWVFYIYITLLTFPTIMLGFVVNLTQRGVAALARLDHVLSTVPSIAERADTLPVTHIQGRVRFEHLDFAYPGHEATPALCDVSWDVRAGQTVGIVGTVGSGKSTLVSVIPRLLEIPDGRVYIDEHDLNRLPLTLLRSSIAMVPQDSFLFSTTVAENIRFGKPEASMDEVRQAARGAHVLRDIEDFPQGFDTPAGERGVTLSGGQRQRIALARALLLDPSILILDDALSSVDHETETQILTRLRSASAQHTCFIVAHRLSAVQHADHIVVLEQGRIAEHGTHDELVRRDGFYAKLWRQQQLEGELGLEAEP